MPPQVPLGWPYPRRKSFLEQLALTQSPKYSHPIRFQGSVRPYPVYTVEIALPKYRLANGRTQAGQEKYLAANPQLGEDFFTRDPELEEAQSVQHRLLKALVDNTTLMNYFTDPANSQEQPLILTSTGFVVNGNRRLCALRELYTTDPQTYTRYSHVDVLVLPYCTDKDIDELEAYLQIQPDIKEDYTWIAKACMLRARQQRYKYSDDQLAGLYAMKTKEVASSLAQLALVDQYLTSRGKPRQYDLVEQAEYAFKQLHRGRQQIRQPEDRDAFTELSFALIDAPETAEGRLYERIPDLKDNLTRVIERLAVAAGPLPTVPASSAQSLLGAPPSPSQAEAVAMAMHDPDKRPGAVEVVVDVIESHKEAKRQRAKANAVLNEVAQANSHLSNAVSWLDERTTTDGLAVQLDAIDSLVAKIREWLKHHA